MNLHPKLEADSVFIKDLELCQVRLINNAKFPWILLVPRVENMVEIIDLDASQQVQLMQEIITTSSVLKELFAPDKLNIGALGNIVPQLHIHVIARYKTDEAWPNPVWNSGVRAEYDMDTLNQRIMALNAVYNRSLHC
jgi:diadenosine tetraphosphate (Ap4A) HIT family hydrolase